MRGEMTRTALTRIGRASLDSCVDHGGLDQPGLLQDARAAYDRLLARMPWPERLANRGYSVLFVLPIAALYSVLRARGLSQQEAVDAARVAFFATGERERAFFTMVFRTGLGRRLFLRSLRPNWLWLTPPPENLWTVTQRTPEAVTIEISRCYRWDTFRLLGVPEVARVACDYEERMFTGSPHLQVSWSSMPAGAERCRACLRSTPAAADR